MEGAWVNQQQAQFVAACKQFIAAAVELQCLEPRKVEQRIYVQDGEIEIVVRFSDAADCARFLGTRGDKISMLRHFLRIAGQSRRLARVVLRVVDPMGGRD